MKKLFTLTVLMGFVVVACAPMLADTITDATTVDPLPANRLIPYSSTTSGYNTNYGSTNTYSGGLAPLLVGNPGANLLVPSVISVQNNSTNWSGGPVKGNRPTILAAVPTVTMIAGIYLGNTYVPIAFDFNDANYVDIAQLMIWKSDSSTITNIGTANAYTSGSVSGNYLTSTGISANNTQLLFQMDVNPNPSGGTYSYVTDTAYGAAQPTDLLAATNGIVIKNVSTGSSKVEAAFLIPVSVFAGLSATTQIYLGMQTGGTTGPSGGDEQFGFIGSFTKSSFMGTNSTLSNSYFGVGSNVTQTITYTTAQALGLIALTEGETTITNTNTGGAAGSSVISFTGLYREGCSTLNFTSASASKDIFRFIPNLSPTNQLYDTHVFFYGADYAVINNSNGDVRAVNYLTDTNVATSAGGAAMASVTGKDVSLTGALTAQTTDSVNSIKMSGSAFNVTLASNAVLTTNGILRSGAFATTIGGSGTAGIQAATDQDLVVRTDISTSSVTIDVPVKANGSNRFVKSGAGTVNLTGTSTYTGETCINAGTLNVTGSIAQSSEIKVQNTGTLAGTGTAGSSTSLTSVNPGGTVSPGNATTPRSTLTIGGDINFVGTGSVNTPTGTTVNSALNLSESQSSYTNRISAGTNSVWNTTTNTVNADYIANLSNLTGTANVNDRLTVNGGISINGGTVVTLSLTYTPTTSNIGDAFKLLDWTTAFTMTDWSPTTSTDLVLPTLSAGLWWNLNYFSTYGVAIIAPEPGRGLLLALGLAAMIMRRRRR